MSADLVLAVAGPGENDGIGDYAWHLTRALSAADRTALLLVRGRAPGPALSPAEGQARGAAIERITTWAKLQTSAWRDRCRDAEGVFVQYFPQAFVAPDFDALVDVLRARRRHGVPVVITLHEYWPHASLSPRREIARWRSRRALRELVEVSTAMVVSQPYSVGELVESGIVPRERLHVIPVGSSVPKIGVPGFADSETPILAMFGQPAMMNARVVTALAKWLAAVPRPPRLWWFSRSEAELRAWWLRHIGVAGESVMFHGGLPADLLSRRLQEVTIGLALYADGASTRRSSLAALLEHGLPIVALDGRYTDDRLRTSGALLFVSPDDRAAVPQAVEALLADPARRHEMSAAAERLFSQQLAWPIIAAAYRAVAGASP